jgi:uncharacterized Ntn-hydrolase superfamily protein
MNGSARLVVLASLIITHASVGASPLATPEPRRPAHTYSIVARDAETGQLGVAVQTHWFSVGTSVAWAAPGVGAVATQSFVDPDYGPLGLELMRAGKTAQQSLAALLAADPHAAVRQVGMVGADGSIANHSGANCIPEFCDALGEGYTVQANLMWRPTVCAAMRRAFDTSKGDLAERLMAALDAAEAEGGDIRGKQSAALLVVSGDRSDPPWGGRIFDLNVEDHAEPLRELRRLLQVARAYRFMNEGDEFMADGNVDRASEAYGRASSLLPESHETVFWHAVALASAGRTADAMPFFAQAFERWPRWREAVQRLPAAGLLPDDPELMEKILAIE